MINDWMLKTTTIITELMWSDPQQFSLTSEDLKKSET